MKIKILTLAVFLGGFVGVLYFNHVHRMVPYFVNEQYILTQLACYYIESPGVNSTKSINYIRRLQPTGNYCYISLDSSLGCNSSDQLILKKYFIDNTVVIAGRKIIDIGYDVWRLNLNKSIEHFPVDGPKSIIPFDYTNCKEK